METNQPERYILQNWMRCKMCVCTRVKSVAWIDVTTHNMMKRQKKAFWHFIVKTNEIKKCCISYTEGNKIHKKKKLQWNCVTRAHSISIGFYIALCVCAVWVCVRGVIRKKIYGIVFCILLHWTEQKKKKIQWQHDKHSGIGNCAKEKTSETHTFIVLSHTYTAYIIQIQSCNILIVHSNECVSLLLLVVIILLEKPHPIFKQTFSPKL